MRRVGFCVACLPVLLLVIGPTLVFNGAFVYLQFYGRECTDAEVLSDTAGTDTGVRLFRGLLGEAEVANMRGYILSRIGGANSSRYWCGVSDEFGGEQERARCLLPDKSRDPSVVAAAATIEEHMSRLPGFRAGQALGRAGILQPGQVTAVHRASNLAAVNLPVNLLTAFVRRYGSHYPGVRAAMRECVCPAAPWLCQAWSVWHLDVPGCTPEHDRNWAARDDWWVARPRHGRLVEEPACNHTTRRLYDRVMLMVYKEDGSATASNLRVLPRGAVRRINADLQAAAQRWGLAGWLPINNHPNDNHPNVRPLLTESAVAWLSGMAAWLPNLVELYLFFALKSALVGETDLRQFVASLAGCTVAMKEGDVLWFAHDIPHQTQGNGADRVALIMGSCANCDDDHRPSELTELRARHDELEKAKAPLPAWHRIRCSSGMCLI
jgi:hypothetical protein